MTTLMRLSYFVAIIDAGSITAAADELRLTQPALSRQLAALEREVGVALFERAGRRTSLTAAGRAFEREARGMLRQASQLERAARELRGGQPSELTIAAPDSTLAEVVAPCLATLAHEAFPVIARTVSSLTPAREALRAADLVVTAGPPEAGLGTRTLGRVPICAHVAPTHPWARDGVTAVDVAELAGSGLIVQTTDNRSRVLLDTVLAARGIRTTILATSELESVVQALAASGYGIGVLTESPKFGAHAVRLFDAERPLEVVMRASWQPEHFAAAAIAELAERLRAQLQQATARIADAQRWE